MKTGHRIGIPSEFPIKVLSFGNPDSDLWGPLSSVLKILDAYPMEISFSRGGGGLGLYQFSNKNPDVTTASGIFWDYASSRK